MAELNDFVHSVKRNYLRLRNEPHRCVIVQAGDRIQRRVRMKRPPNRPDRAYPLATNQEYAYAYTQRWPRRR